MQGGRKTKKILILVLSNLLVWIGAAYLSSGIAAQVSATGPSNQQAQIEKGRQVVGQTCVACHTNILRMLQIHKKSADQWKDTVYSMVGRGAQIMPDEMDFVTAFLVATAGGNRETATQAPGGGRRPGRAEQQAPEAEGRAVLQRTCQQCHDMATATTKLASEDWTAVIAKMMTYGGKVTHADQQKLVEYLNGLAK
jgi:mono/diheme cytochrome c family protein